MGLTNDIFDQLVADKTADQADAKSGKSSTRRELEAATRDMVGQSAGALGLLTGSDTLNEFAEGQRKVSDRLRSRSDYVQQFDDVHGVGDLASYIAKLGLATAPTIASMVVGGAGGAALAARGLTGAAELAAASRGINVARGAGALSTQELASIGQVAEAQKDQSGEADVGSSVALGTVNNLLNLGGVEGMAVRGLPKSAAKSAIARRAAGAAQTAIEEGAAEVGQQATEEFGRKAVDDNYDVLNPEAMARYKESAIGGALLGGVAGGITTHKEKEKAPGAKPTIDDAPADPADLLRLEKPSIKAQAPASATAAPTIGDDFFTGATPETLRPTDGPASVLRVLKGEGPAMAVQQDLAVNITKALNEQNVAQAEHAVEVAQNELAKKNVKGEAADRAAQSLVTATEIIDSYKRNHERLAPGKLAGAAGQVTPDLAPEGYDPLQVLATQEPSLDDVRVASKGLSPKVAPAIHTAIKNFDYGTAREIISQQSKSLETASVNSATIEKRLEALKRLEGVVDDHEAYHQILDQSTRPASPVTDMAEAAKSVASPGATVTLPPVNNEQSVQQVQEQNAAAQTAKPTPDSGNQTKLREDLLHEAMQSGEKNVDGEFKKLLALQFPDPKDRAQRVLTLDEHRKIREYVMARKNADLTSNVAKASSAITDEAAVETPPPETQDTTLGVKEKVAKAPVEKAAPKAVPAEKAQPAQGEMFSPRKMGPTSTQEKKAFSRRQLELKALEPRAPEVAPKSTQTELFQGNKKPTAAARGESEASRAFQVEQARSMNSKAAKAVLAQLDDLVAQYPKTPATSVINIAKMVQNSKFAAAGREIEAEKARQFKATPPKVEPLKPGEKEARANYADLMSKYENEVKSTVVDKALTHLQKGEFEKANKVVDVERARIEKVITKAGVANPAEAKGVTPKSKTVGAPVMSPRQESDIRGKAKTAEERVAANKEAAKEAALEPIADKLPITKEDAETRAIAEKFAPVTDPYRAALNEISSTTKDAGKVRDIHERLAAGESARDILQDHTSARKFAAIDVKANPKGDLPNFSRTEVEPMSHSAPDADPDGGQRVAAVQSHVDALTKDWANPPRIEVFDSRNPKTSAQFVAMHWVHKEGGTTYGLAMKDPSNGEQMIMILADKMPNAEEIKATLFHEALGHYGMRGVYGKGLAHLMHRIYDTTPAFRAEVDRLRAESSLKPKDPIHYFGEEVFAYASEQGIMTKPGILTRVQVFLQGLARRMGWRTGAFSPGEISRILRLAHEHVVDNGPPTKPSTRMGDVKLDRNGLLPRTEGLLPRTKNELLPRKPEGWRLPRIGDPDDFSFRREASVGTDTRTQNDKIRENLNKVHAPEGMVSAAISANAVFNRYLPGMMFGRDLVDYAKNLLPTYGTFHNLLQGKQTIANDYTRTIDTIMTDAYRLGKLDVDGKKVAGELVLSEYMRDATMSEKWGYQPEWITKFDTVGGKLVKVKKIVDIDPVEKARYDALPKPVQDLADRVFEQGFKAREELREQVRVEREAEAADEMAKARTETERREIARQKQRAARLFDNKVPSLAGPYAPLMRFGDYITVAKSAEMTALEATENPTAADREKLQDMRSDPKHFNVQMFETMGQAERMKQEHLKNGFADVYAAPKEEYYRGVSDAPWLAMTKLKQMVKDQLEDNDNFDKKAVHKINMLLRDLYYSALAEDSARKHDLRRERVPGVHADDMLRAFASKGRADGHFIAALQSNSEMTRQLQVMKEAANIKDEKLAQRKALFNEVLARHAASMQYDATPIQDKMMAFSSVYHLMMMPRYYIQNAMQTGMVTAPILSGRFGASDTWAEIFKAYKVFGPAMKSVGGMKEFASGKFDIEKLDLPADEKAFLTDLRKGGLVDIGLNYDMGYWDTGSYPGAKFLNSFTHTLRTASQQIEVLNRVSAGLASYRLAKSRGIADPAAYATGVVSQTHGDYSRTNAPRLLNMLPKVVTQFRKYQIIQLSLLTRHMANSFAKASTPEAKAERAVARRTMAWLIGQTGLVTGALGLPAVQATSYLIAAMFGPPDEPTDGEKYMRDIIGSQDLADLILKGLPAAAGVDLSMNLGLSSATSVLPYSDMDFTSRQGLQEIAGSALGPTFGIGMNFADAAGYFKMGNTQKAIESAMPSGPRALMRAWRLATQGATKRNGDLLMKPEEFSFMEQVATALGFTTTKVADQRRLQGDLMQYDEYFKGRTTQFKYAYTQAAKANDLDEMSNIREAWMKLQEAKKRTGFKPASVGDLLKAPAEQKRRERATAGGVQYRANSKGFVETQSEQ